MSSPYGILSPWIVHSISQFYFILTLEWLGCNPPALRKEEAMWLVSKMESRQRYMQCRSNNLAWCCSLNETRLLLAGLKDFLHINILNIVEIDIRKTRTVHESNGRTSHLGSCKVKWFISFDFVKKIRRLSHPIIESKYGSTHLSMMLIWNVYPFTFTIALIIKVCERIPSVQVVGNESH